METLLILLIPTALLAACAAAAVGQGWMFLQFMGLRRRLSSDRRELEGLSGMKSKFLSMAAHDVRTPLASIRGFGEMLRKGSSDPRMARYADNVVKGADHIRRLMEDLTDLAVIEAGKLRMEKGPFDLAGMISDAASTAEFSARQKGVALSLDLPPRGIVVEADRFRLSQALLNLLGNAVKFTPPGGSVRLGAALDRASGAVLIWVRDTGRGIHPSERGRIFETFYQSRYSRAADRKKGWGLGLAIAREIVRGHRGEIGVDSSGLGRGSSFWLKIPARAGSAGGRPAGTLGAAALVLAALLPVSGRAQAPFSEKIAFERSLEARAEAVAARLLGPGLCRVAVNAALDFSRFEKVEVKEPKPEKTPADFFRADSGEPMAEPAELLPGIPMPETLLPPGAPSYEKRATFPASFIRKLSVTVVIEKGVSVEKGDELSRILTDVLDIQPDRGDVLSLVRAPFAPAGKANPLLWKYVFLGLVSTATLLVTGLGLFKLAGAMDAMAKAQQLPIEPPLQVPEAPVSPLEETAVEPSAPPPPIGSPPQAVTFDVPPGSADALARLLGSQDPENVAFVAARLPPETRDAFLARLPEALAGSALRHLDDASPVDPVLLGQVKAELERRAAAPLG